MLQARQLSLPTGIILPSLVAHQQSIYKLYRPTTSTLRDNLMSNLPLPQFYGETLGPLLPILDDIVSSTDPAVQSTLSTALDNLHLIGRMITSLGVFSENESADELGDGELRFMSLGWVIGECEGKLGLGGREDRVSALKRSEAAYGQFLSLLTSYGVLNEEERAEGEYISQAGGLPKDPTKRREMKIRQYRREKELKQQISAGLPSQPDASSNPLVFLMALFPTGSSRPRMSATAGPSSSTSVNAEDEPVSRSTTILLLRLLHTMALASLASNGMELEILASAPASLEEVRDDDPRQAARGEEDDTWRLDMNGKPSRVKPRELISGGGRVLRPFTILPSTLDLSDRERLHGEVFRESWRLPSMTIDEYLAEEQRRGNIITGGGQASYDAPTESELLELAAEDDGTVAGESNFEQKRQKEEKWAQYTDANKKGAGNTMNRG